MSNRKIDPFAKEKTNSVVLLDDNRAKKFRQVLRDNGFSVAWTWFECDGRSYVLVEWE